MNLAWLIPDDAGGGVASVGEACCRQAVQAGHKATLLMMRRSLGHASEFGGFETVSLEQDPPFRHAASRIVEWLSKNRQDWVVMNACSQADIAIPHVPETTRIMYVVHDTAAQYYSAAIRHESSIDAIVAVSETVAAKFRGRLVDQNKLFVAHNGSVFTHTKEDARSAPRGEDLIFLGGANPAKGAVDVLRLWPLLLDQGFSGGLHWFGRLDDHLTRKIRSLPESGKITLHGHARRSEVFSAALTCKVLLMLSREEPFGMATVEAGGLGCVPVAWDVETGTKEIAPSGLGIFVPLGNFHGLAEGVIRALEEYPLRSAPLVDHVRAYFSERSMWERYHSIFETLSTASPTVRVGQSVPVPEFRTPFRMFQILPRPLRYAIIGAIGKFPRIGRFVSNMRGW